MIVGININSIESEKKDDDVKGKISINSTPYVVGVRKTDVGDMKDLLAVEFSFKVTYEPNVGNIVIKGEVLYKTNDTKDIVKKWKEEEVLDPDISVEVLNTVFRKCLVRAIQISEDLRLPPPVRFPLVTKEEPNKKGE